MELLKWKASALDAIKKYRFAALVLGVGLLLMLLPGKKQDVSAEEPQPTVQTVTVTEELTQILAQIQGVGKVRVMLTVSTGETTVYQYDEDRKEGDNPSFQKDTVIIADSQRNESGLVQQIVSPQYRGALVVCDGADQPSVCLAVVEAVSRITGLSTDRISVLKMK